MRYIFILTLLLCRTGISFAQYDSIVKANRVKYQQTHNKLDAYETEKSTFTIETGENVQGTAYYEGNDLKVIEVIYLSEAGHRQIEYYFENGNLYFILERKQPAEEAVSLNVKGTKSTKAGTASPGDRNVTETRYYFYEDKLIRWFDNERNEIDITTGANSTTGAGLVTNAYKMKEKLKK